MNNENGNRLLDKSRRILFIGVSICLILLLSIGVSYSMWRQTLVGTSSIIATTDCFDVSITSEENAISLGDEAIVDADYKGIALTPYTFTIKNKCNVNATYSVNLILFSTTDSEGTDKTLDEQYVKTFLQGNNKEVLSMVNKLDSLSNDVMVNDMKITASNLKSGYVLTSDVIGANEEVTYNLNLWIDNSSEEELSSNLINDKVFNAKIYIKSEPTTSSSTTTTLTPSTYVLNSRIVINNRNKGELTSTLLAETVTDDNSGLYESADDYGTSYVFRGTKTKTNNHVIFGDYCYQIIRINGDGSIRIMYNGTPTDGACTTDNEIIGIGTYNDDSEEPMYVGYMYGTDQSSATASEEAYDLANANTNNSNIKAKIDDWYKTNFVDKNTDLAELIVDTGFCNDRSVEAPNSYVQNDWIGETVESYGSTTDGGGCLTDKYTFYGGWNRVFREDLTSSINPTLKCKQNNDYFTKSTVSTTTGITGNSKLTYPVATVTADELMLSGLYYYSVSDNSNVWTISTGWNYWSLSPAYYSAAVGYSSVFLVGEDGLGEDLLMENTNGFRPVFNLSSEAKIYEGEGSTEEPFLVQTN